MLGKRRKLDQLRVEQARKEIEAIYDLIGQVREQCRCHAWERALGTDVVAEHSDGLEGG